MASHDEPTGGLCEHCATGVVKDYTGKGKEITIADKLACYVNGPDDAKTAVVVFHDIFGFSLPNTRLVCDQIANSGHYVIFPDYFYGNARKPGAPSSPEIHAAFLKANPDERTQADVLKVIKYIKDTKKISNIGFVGFCWGGRQAFTGCSSKDVKVCVSLHGGGITVEQTKSLVVPSFLFVQAGDDKNPTTALVQDIQKALKESGKLAELKIFPGMVHGFTVRGDENDPKVSAASKESIRDTITFLNAHL